MRQLSLGGTAVLCHPVATVTGCNLCELLAGFVQGQTDAVQSSNTRNKKEDESNRLVFLYFSHQCVCGVCLCVCLSVPMAAAKKYGPDKASLFLFVL